MKSRVAEFFGLSVIENAGENDDRPAVWQLPVVPRVSSGMGALFGGVGLGACVEALEQHCDRPVVWATGQYLSFAHQGALLEVGVDEIVRGRKTSQARAVVCNGDEEILTVNAALGSRPGDTGGVYERMPTGLPAPEDCPPRELLARHTGTIAAHIDVRLADARGLDALPGPPGDGACALWVRIPDLDTSVQTSAGALSIIGDYVPFGISQALGQLAGGNSLDNTIRIVSRRPTEWILAHVQIHAIADGFGHGLVHLWARDGTLLATASQSTIVRAWRDQPRSG